MRDFHDDNRTERFQESLGARMLRDEQDARWGDEDDSLCACGALKLRLAKTCAECSDFGRWLEDDR